jgi:hypothetical protein
MMKEENFDVITSKHSLAPGETWFNPDHPVNVANTFKTDVIGAINTIADSTVPDKKIDYKYCEEVILTDFLEYLDKTYGQHYKTKTHKIECFDAWIAMGDATPTFRNTAIKYLWRYGRKKSYAESKDDLFKAMHYVLMCMYNDHYKQK